jgi:hypothetical protein
MSISNLLQSNDSSTKKCKQKLAKWEKTGSIRRS